MSVAIAFEHVSFAYPDTDRPVLDDVSLTIPEGAFVLVAGATGAGKSTFLRAINGLVPHFTGGTFSGSVRVFDRSTTTEAPRDLADVVAYVPQDPAAAFVLDRVEDELAYGMENLGIAPEVMRRRVEETLDLMGLESSRDRSVRSLSGGERQRVAIAASLAARPRILVLDEPTSQLDPQGAEDVLAALQRLVHDLGLTVVIAEHRLERVAGFVDLAIGCGGGRCILGDPSDIVSRFASGPPVARLGRLVGWSPVPLTVRAARRLRPSEMPVPDAAIVRSSGPVLVKASGVRAAYDDKSVLHGIDLELRQGEIVALMGRNGSGKSTLLRTLTGVHPLEEGSVEIEGREPEPGRTVALCPQAPESILFKGSVHEEIEASVEWSGSGLDVNALLTVIGILDLADAHPRDLSAGEKLLVATAATAATGAPVLLLDEPTKGLDAANKNKLGSFLASHARNRGASIFATHDVEMAAEIATRVVMLAAGEVIADGPPALVLGDSPVFAPQMSRVFGPGWLTPEQVQRELFPEEVPG